MSDFLNNALNASDCVASAVATTVSLLHTQTGRTGWKDDILRTSIVVPTSRNIFSLIQSQYIFGIPRAA